MPKDKIDAIVTVLTTISVLSIIVLAVTLAQVEQEYAFLLFFVFLPVYLQLEYRLTWGNYCKDMRLIKGETKKLIRRKRKILKLHAKNNELKQKKVQHAEVMVLNKRIKDLKKEIKG